MIFIMPWKMCIKNWPLILLSLFQSCSLPIPYERMFVRSDWNDETLSPAIIKLGIAFTGNFHNNLLAHKEQVPLHYKESPRYLKIGGAQALRSYLEIFKKRYDTHLVLDSGNLFTNKADPQVKKQTLKLYDEIGYDAMAMTDPELLDFVKHKENYANFSTPILATNIVNLTTGYPLNDHSIAPYKIVDKEGIRIGLISFTYPGYLSGRDQKKMTGFYFEDPVASFLRVKQIFKKEKIDLTIAMVRLDGQCNNQVPSLTSKGGLKSPHPVTCDKDSLIKTIKRLPPNSIDLIISGDNRLALGYLEGIPIAQIEGKGKYLGLLELYYNTTTKKLLQSKTHFHPPIKLCHNFFSSTQDCYIKETKRTTVEKLFSFIHQKSYRPIPAKFLGYEVVVEEHLSSSSIKENTLEYH